MIKVLGLVPYPEESPSTRIRVSQYRAALKEKGILLEVAPFLGPAAFRQIYRPGLMRKVWNTLDGFRARLRQIAGARDFDLLLVHRELAPFFAPILLRRLLASRLPVLFDLDDAVFLPAVGENPLAALLKRPGRDTRALAQVAVETLAGNDFLASHVDQVGGRATLLPTTVDIDLFTPKRGTREAGPLRLVWVGTHTTMGYLKEAIPALKALQGEIPMEIVVVSNQPPETLDGLPVKGIPWALSDEISYYQDADIGFYPLPDDPWTRGKCGLKALQFMACGVPVVASPVGVLRRLIVPGKTGFLARNTEDWKEGVLTLARDELLRTRLGEEGRRLVEQEYSLRHGTDILAGAIRRAVDGRWK
jgi:glycosyltransferase involved in cell wall biosynthesis